MQQKHKTSEQVCKSMQFKKIGNHEFDTNHRQSLQNENEQIKKYLSMRGHEPPEHQLEKDKAGLQHQSSVNLLGVQAFKINSSKPLIEPQSCFDRKPDQRFENITTI